MNEKAIAQALETADWSNVSIGNKAVILAAIDALRALPPLRAREESDIALVKELYEDAERLRTLNIVLSKRLKRAADALSRTAGPEWRDISSEMLGALHGMHAFIAVMFGRGPDATIPETVNAPIGVPIKVGEIMREATAVIAKAEAALPAPPVAEGRGPQLTDIHLRLLKRGASGKYIGLSDNMGIRMGELSALGDLHRMGFAESAKGPFPPGPPSPTPSVITDAGRAFLAEKSEVKS